MSIPHDSVPPDPVSDLRSDRRSGHPAGKTSGRVSGSAAGQSSGRLQAWPSSVTNGRFIAGAVRTVLLTLFLLILLFPVFWMASSSFQLNEELYRSPPRWLPVAPTLANYQAIFESRDFLRYYGNNAWVSTLTTVLTMFASVFAGYSLSRFRNRTTRFISTALLSTQMFPVIGIIIALYAFFKSLGIINTHSGLVLSLTASSLPFCIWLIKGFFDDLPKSIEEAAEIDGCSRLGTLTRIVIPLSKPGLLAIGIFTFMQAWDDYLYGLTLVASDRLRTLSVGISLRYLGEAAYDWAQVTTISVVASIPVLVLFVFFQKYMIQGLTAGAVKG